MQTTKKTIYILAAITFVLWFYLRIIADVEQTWAEYIYGILWLLIGAPYWIEFYTEKKKSALVPAIVLTVIGILNILNA